MNKNAIRPYELKVKEAAEIINNMPSIDLTKLTVETDGNIEQATRFAFEHKDITPNQSNSILRYNGLYFYGYAIMEIYRDDMGLFFIF